MIFKYWQEGKGGYPTFKVVVNLGYSPTFDEQENAKKIVEARTLDYQ